MGAVKRVDEMVETGELQFASCVLASGCVDGAKIRFVVTGG